MPANSRPSLVLKISKVAGDPNKAAKKLEADAKKLFNSEDRKSGEKAAKGKKKEKKVRPQITRL